MWYMSWWCSLSLSLSFALPFSLFSTCSLCVNVIALGDMYLLQAKFIDVQLFLSLTDAARVVDGGEYVLLCSVESFLSVSLSLSLYIFVTPRKKERERVREKENYHHMRPYWIAYKRMRNIHQK